MQNKEAIMKRSVSAIIGLGFVWLGIIAVSFMAQAAQDPVTIEINLGDLAKAAKDGGNFSEDILLQKTPLVAGKDFNLSHQIRFERDGVYGVLYFLTDIGAGQNDLYYNWTNEYGLIISNQSTVRAGKIGQEWMSIGMVDFSSKLDSPVVYDYEISVENMQTKQVLRQSMRFAIS